MAKLLVVTQRLDHFQHLSEDELKIAERIAAKLSTLTSTKASDLSHQNVGWQIAYAAGLGSGSGGAKAIDMLVALQQLGNADPWLSEEPDEDLRAITDRAHEAATDWPD